MTTFAQSFTTRHVPWMKIGTIIDDASVDSAEAARLGGIDFEVELTEAGYRNQDGEWVVQPTRRAVIHKDTEEWFGYVSDLYQPVQYHEAFAFMDGINPRYVAAGAMSDGRQGFMVVQLPQRESLDVTVNGVDDPHDMYVILRTSHDLSKGISVAVMPLRNKCMNMLPLPSMNRNVPQSWSIPHVGDPHAKLKQAQVTLQRADAYGDLFEKLVAQLGSVRVTNDDLRHIMRRVLPTRLKTRDDMADQIVDRFQTAETVGFQETGWGAINAVSDYMQWGRSSAARTNQSEFTSGLDGDTAKYVNLTTQLVLNLA